MAGHKPVIVYFHRYPMELEHRQHAAMKLILDRLKETYAVAYFSMRGNVPPDGALRAGIRLLSVPWRVDQKSQLSKYTSMVAYYLYLPIAWLRLRRLAPALIICKEPLPFVPWLIGLTGYPILITTSDWWWSTMLGGSAWGRRLAKRLESFEVRRWNGLGATIAATSRAEASLVVERGMRPDRIAVINAPNAPGIFASYDAHAERLSMGFSGGHWVVAVHGIIRPGKGYLQLLEWWRDLVRIHPNWRLLIIGGAGGETWCRRQIRRLELEANVHMTGWLPTQTDVNRHLNAADCLLVIRRNSEDNCGIIPSALYHSLATGRPTVATGLAGMAEIVRHGVDGYLFEPDNFDSFRTVLEYIASHPEEAAQVGRSGMAREKECFNPDIAAVKTVELIDRMLAKGTGEVRGA